jgi:nucleoside-diphosphate-sugar epimerase
MRKIAFVTGGAGFLGRHLIEALLDANWQVTALVRGQVPAWMNRPGLTVQRGALDQPDTLRQAMPEQPDAVLHAAGAISMWSRDLPDLLRDNVAATRNVIDVSRQRGARRLVMTSTLGVFRAEQGPVTESLPLRRIDGERNPYLRTKLMADEALQVARQHGLSTVSLHPSHMLGPHDRAGWIKMFDDAVAGKLKAAPCGRASFCPVESVARAHVAAATLATPAPRYALGGPAVSYLDVFNAIAKLTGSAPVTSVVPPLVLKTVAQASEWWSRIDRRRPELTPGLADILCGDMVADSRLGIHDLGYQEEPIASLLQRVHAHWSAAGSLRRAA